MSTNCVCDENKKLWLGLPKGSLQESTFALLKNAGWPFTVSSRSYYPTCNDPTISAMLVRPQEMGRYIERGALDVGITGRDWLQEVDADVEVICELTYAKATNTKVRWVLAVPEDSPWQSVKDLQGKAISTEVVNLTRKFLAANGVEAQVEFSHGATEVKVPFLADAIVDITETGSSLKANRLRIIETIAESNTVLAVNKAVLKDSWKMKKIEALSVMLSAALLAQSKVLLKLNVHRDNLDRVVALLPAMHAPSIVNQTDDNFVAVETVAEQGTLRDLILPLREAGASGILEIPLNKVIN